ncbi:MAG: hypothetical protein KAJ19_08690, partial [Gammaproteobacteria bacterium]|nr:hypothetical protein [Gammaproteobacteria bacterium]
LRGKYSNGDFGTSVSTAGNVDASSGSEVVVGEPGKDRSYVFYGPIKQTASTDWPVFGTVTNTYTSTQSSDDSYEILEEEAGTGGNTDTLIVYGQYNTASPWHRVWSAGWGAQTADGNFAATIDNVIARSNPTRNEIVAGAVCGANTAPESIYVNVWNGVTNSWGTPLEVTAATPQVSAFRQFDIAIESQSGDALVIYADGGNNFAYRVWDGSSWSAEQTYDITEISGGLVFIEAASNPNSDEIAVLVTDVASDAQGLIWDGDSFGNQQLLETLLGLNSRQCHDVEYMQSSGEAMYVWGPNINGFEYRIWDGTWSAENEGGADPPLGDNINWCSLQTDPNSDRLILSYVDTDTDIGTKLWDGTGWQAGVTEHDITGETTARRCVDATFESVTGHSQHIVLVYGDGANTVYKHWNGASWNIGPTSLPSQPGGDVSVVQLRRDADGLIFLSTVESDYDLNSWTWSSATSSWTFRTELNIDLSYYAPPTEAFMVAPSCPLPSQSKLEHKWNITITASYENTFYLEANRTDEGEGD